MTVDPNPRYADACEGHGEERVLAVPAMAIPDGDGGLIAAYRCPQCRRTWTCSWGIVPGRIRPPAATEPVALGDLELIRQLQDELLSQRTGGAT